MLTIICQDLNSGSEYALFLVCIPFCYPSLIRPEWLLSGSVTQLVLAIISKDTQTTLERWVFDVHLQEGAADADGAGASARCVTAHTPGDTDCDGRHTAARPSPKRRSRARYARS
jgi:hypothetical protein